MGILDVFRKKSPRPFCSAVIVAAGLSERMGEDKMELELLGVPVLARSLMAFEQSDVIDEIIVVTREDRIVDVAHLCRQYGLTKVTKVLVGGSTRTESALAGLSEIDRRAELAAIHDGARPLVTDEVISRTVAAAAEYNAAAPGVPLKDTVKFVKDGVVTGTPDRSSLTAVQTPQVFRQELIKGALTRAVQEGTTYTDDCAAAEALGIPVHIVEGSYDNLKITTPADIAAAEWVLGGR